MPTRSPLEAFIDNLQEAAIDAIEGFIDGIAEQGREHARRVARTLPPPQASRERPTRQDARSSPRRRPKRPAAQESRQLTLYDILEVVPTASDETVSAAFRSLSRRYHPDNKETGDDEKFKRISAAWTVLKDPATRKKYNRAIGLAK